jgi:hypothetical protein
MGERGRNVKEYWSGDLGGNIYIKASATVLLFVLVVNGAGKE